MQAFRLPDVAMTPSYEATPLTAYHLTVTSGGTHLGIVARLAEALADAFDLKAPAYFAELDWTTAAALAAPHLERPYQTISRSPVAERDIAVVVRRDQAVGPMVATIEEAGRPLLRQVGVFDLYEGQRIDPGKKSVAFSLRFGADRTLNDAEVDQCVAAIVKQLGQAYQAVLRQ